HGAGEEQLSDHADDQDGQGDPQDPSPPRREDPTGRKEQEHDGDRGDRRVERPALEPGDEGLPGEGPGSGDQRSKQVLLAEAAQQQREPHPDQRPPDGVAADAGDDQSTGSRIGDGGDAERDVAVQQAGVAQRSVEDHEGKGSRERHHCEDPQAPRNSCGRPLSHPAASKGVASSWSPALVPALGADWISITPQRLKTRLATTSETESSASDHVSHVAVRFFTRFTPVSASIVRSSPLRGKGAPITERLEASDAPGAITTHARAVGRRLAPKKENVLKL